MFDFDNILGDVLNTWYVVISNPDIKNVIFNDPATIVLWADGSKTVVKCENEKFDPEKGLAMAISKKYFRNKGSYYNEFKKWIPNNEPVNKNNIMDMLPKKKFEGIDWNETRKKVQEEISNLKIKEKTIGSIKDQYRRLCYKFGLAPYKAYTANDIITKFKLDTWNCPSKYFYDIQYDDCNKFRTCADCYNGTCLTGTQLWAFLKYWVAKTEFDFQESPQEYYEHFIPKGV